MNNLGARVLFFFHSRINNKTLGPRIRLEFYSLAIFKINNKTLESRIRLEFYSWNFFSEIFRRELDGKESPCHSLSVAANKATHKPNEHQHRNHCRRHHRPQNCKAAPDCRESCRQDLYSRYQGRIRPEKRHGSRCRASQGRDGLPLRQRRN